MNALTSLHTQRASISNVRLHFVFCITSFLHRRFRPPEYTIFLDSFKGLNLFGIFICIPFVSFISHVKVSLNKVYMYSTGCEGRMISSLCIKKNL